ncbi:hypothetical protein ACFOY8_14455 [Thalassospira xianhensis]|uniref:Uncharacterized protein n=1 Tax=Thalassospira xianhensis MCCC 1A02616 TaxID=1177929 RepID=A0A367UH66_9PROT|nr:hypothetical protein [Thalassospira xianhensis]RCK07646.1 hypothetical protein TH5_00795 [Thalassospira xianhensis MCCC 1A02616]
MDITSELIQKYTSGLCYPMAIALHTITGWPIQTVSVRSKSRSGVAHSWVKSPDGLAFDISGAFIQGAMVDRYAPLNPQLSEGDLKRYKEYRRGMLFSTHRTTAEFLEELQDFYGEPAKFKADYLPFMWEQVEVAKEIALGALQNYFPELPFAPHYATAPNL